MSKASRKVKLTEAEVKKLPLPENGRANVIYRDVQLRGFGVRVSREGTRSYIVNYRNKHGVERRYTIGRCDDWTLKLARARAEEVKSDARKGKDAMERRISLKESPTVRELCETYINDPHISAKKSAQYYESILKRHFVARFGSCKAEAIEIEDILDMRRAIGDKGHIVAANRAVAVVRAMYTWAIQQKEVKVGVNPAKGVTNYTEKSRQSGVYLYDHLVKDFWDYLENATNEIKTPVRVLLQVELLTGQRHGEWRSLKWSEVEEDWVEFKDTKTGNDHRVPLSPQVKALIERMREYKAERERIKGRVPYSEYVFPGLGGRRMDDTAPAQAVRRMRQHVELPDGFTPHKLRTTMKTGLSRLKYPRALIDRLTNHADTAMGQTYDKYAYPDEKIELACAWANEVDRLVKGEVAQ